jgi:hypothetical protein
MICLDVEAYEPHESSWERLNTISLFKPVITCENGNDAIMKILSHFDYEMVDRSMADTIYAPRN